MLLQKAKKYQLSSKISIWRRIGRYLESVELIEKSSSQNIVSKIVNGGSRVLKIAFWPAYRTGRQGSKPFARKRTNVYGDEQMVQLTPPKPILEHSHLKRTKKQYYRFNTGQIAMF